MKYVIAEVSFWEHSGFNTTFWRKSADGTQAIAHYEHVIVMIPNIDKVANATVYDSVQTKFQDLMKSPAWASLKPNTLPNSYSLLANLEDFKSETTAQLAQTVDEVNRAASELTVDSEVILARGGKTTLGVRINEIEEDAVVKVANELVNTDFKNDRENWLGDVVSVNETSLTTKHRIYQTTSIPDGHKTYVRAEAKKKSGTGNLFITKAPTSFGIISNPIINQWYVLSGVSEEAQLSSAIQISSRIEDVIEIKNNIIAIDLTKTFGTGNEPTAAQMDRLLEQFPNSWFDGTANIFPARWALNELRRLDDEKANRKQDEWITPTILNGYESVPSFPIMYRKDEMGIVRFRGRIQKGNVTGSAYPFLILPNGYKPANNYILYPCSHATKTSVATIGVYNGLYLDSPYNSYVCLDNISFFGEG